MDLFNWSRTKLRRPNQYYIKGAPTPTIELSGEQRILRIAQTAEEFSDNFFSKISNSHQIFVGMDGNTQHIDFTSYRSIEVVQHQIINITRVDDHQPGVEYIVGDQIYTRPEASPEILRKVEDVICMVGAACMSLIRSNA